jgi:hypothetical protein
MTRSPYVGVGDAVADRVDDPGDLVAEDARRRWRILVQALTGHVLGEVDAARANVDADLPGAGRRVRPLLHLQDVVRPVGGQDDGAHGAVPLGQEDHQDHDDQEGDDGDVNRSDFHGACLPRSADRHKSVVPRPPLPAASRPRNRLPWEAGHRLPAPLWGTTLTAHDAAEAARAGRSPS